MQLPYFFAQDISAEKQFILPEETGKHCIQVLRMQPGEQMLLTNGQGTVVTATILVAERKNCVVRVDEKETAPGSDKKVAIAISLLKNTSRFEWFLEKATEIGITEIIPLICKRTEKQYFRKDRMQQILVSAILQSRQSWLPALQDPIAFDRFIAGAGYTTRLIAHCEEQQKQALSEVEINGDTILLIGPEGDFTVDEIRCATESNFVPVSLGNTRLRTETAGIVAAALLQNLSTNHQPAA